MLSRASNADGVLVSHGRSGLTFLYNCSPTLYNLVDDIGRAISTFFGKMQNSKKGPQFVQYFEPVIAALKELGNSGTPAEIRDLIMQKLNISDDFIDGKLNSGASRFENQVY